ncbi:hypothetical protein Tco_0425027 [Tanacetum coccineum]
MPSPAQYPPMIVKNFHAELDPAKTNKDLLPRSIQSPPSLSLTRDSLPTPPSSYTIYIITNIIPSSSSSPYHRIHPPPHRHFHSRRVRMGGSGLWVSQREGAVLFEFITPDKGVGR